jgi:hypothetical protein
LQDIRQVIPWLRQRSLTTVWNMLRRLGTHLRRGREYLHSPDPAYEAKLAAVRQAQTQIGSDAQGAVMLYQDEFTFYRRPTVASAYAAKGSSHPRARLGYRPNYRRRVTGALNALTGRLHVAMSSRCGVRQLIRFYQQLEQSYPQAKRILLVQDNWPVHQHPEVLHWLKSSRLQVLFLPTYAPWTNPIEKVWRRLKQELLHLHPWGDDWLGLLGAVQNWFDRWHEASVDLLRYVGLYPS